MGRFLFGIFLAFFLGNAALAAPVSVPADFQAINIDSDPTQSWPAMYVPLARLWDTNHGANSLVGQWPYMEPTQGNWNFTDFDAVLANMRSRGAQIWWTAGGQTPSWVNSTPCLDTAQRRQYFTDHVAATFNHVGSGKINIFEAWNEYNVSLFWTCTNGGQLMGQVAQTAYAAAKAVDANVFVVTPSVIIGGGAGDAVTNPIPRIGGYWLDQLMLYCDGASSPCYDGLNYHWYVSSVTSNSGPVTFDPTQMISQINQMKALASLHGKSNLPIYGGEGYAGGTPAGGFSMANDFQAGVQCGALLLQGANGLRQSVFYAWQDQRQSGGVDNWPTMRGGLYNISADRGMNNAGVAVKDCTGWQAGATWTVPLQRTFGTNLIGSFSGATAGLISGPGGCSGAPAGMGSLPTGMNFTSSHSTYLSFYVVSTGTDPDGISYLRVRLCGTDLTSGSGQAFPSVNMLSKTAQAWAQNQSGYFGANLRVSAGSYTGIANIYPQAFEYDNTQAFLGQTTYIAAYPVNVPLRLQPVFYRFTGQSATLAALVPSIQLVTWYNSANPYPTDITLDIGAPYLDTNAAQWVGTLVGQDGATRYVAFDDAGSSSYTVPSGYGYYRDVYNVERAVVGGVVTLTQSPIILEQAPAKFIGNGGL